MNAFVTALQILALAIAATALIAGAASDVRHYLIPNRCAAAIALAAVLFMAGAGRDEALAALAIGAAVFAVGVVFFARGWLGGGDVKLLAAVALWVPPALIAPFALTTSLAGAALSLAMLSPARKLLPLPPASLAAAGAAGALRRPVPFGVAIAIGGMFVLCRRFTG